MIIEWAVEDFLFTCRRCDTQWRDAFQVRNVTDADGDVWVFYRHHGQPCEAPTAAENMCPHCHCGPVHVTRCSRAARH